MTTVEKEILAKMLTSHAYREKLAAERFEGAAAMAPAEADRHYIERVSVEECSHFTGCLGVAAELGIELEARVNARMRRLPPGIPEFRTWLDVLLAHTFNDQAGYYVLVGVAGSKVTPYAKLVREILAEEESHGTRGADMLTAYLARDPLPYVAISETLITHLDAAVRCVGRPHSELDAEAVRLGLKTRSSAEALLEFCEYADRVLGGLGYRDLVPVARRYMSTSLQTKGSL